MSIPWLVTPAKIQLAVEQIARIGNPQRVIVFGSTVRGEVGPHSDVDFLVVTKDEVERPREESVRLRRALRGISMPMDILVISAQRLRALADQPGLIYREALRNGKVVYQADG